MSLFALVLLGSVMWLMSAAIRNAEPGRELAQPLAAVPLAAVSFLTGQWACCAAGSGAEDRTRRGAGARSSEMATPATT